MKKGLNWKEKGEEEDEGNLAQISVNAMSIMAVPRFNTKMVTRHVGKQDIHIVIDCCSTHDFINPDVVRKLGLRSVQVAPLILEVANELEPKSSNFRDPLINLPHLQYIASTAKYCTGYVQEK